MIKCRRKIIRAKILGSLPLFPIIFVNVKNECTSNSSCLQHYSNFPLPGLWEKESFSVIVPYLKLTASLHLKMAGWNTFSFPFGANGLFSGANWPFCFREWLATCFPRTPLLLAVQMQLAWPVWSEHFHHFFLQFVGVPHRKLFTAGSPEDHLFAKGKLFEANLHLHLARLTWNLRIHPWKRRNIFQTIHLSGSMLNFWGVYSLLFQPFIFQVFFFSPCESFLRGALFAASVAGAVAFLFRACSKRVRKPGSQSELSPGGFRVWRRRFWFFNHRWTGG